MCSQGKRIENTSARDEPFQFVLGRGQVRCAYVHQKQLQLPTRRFRVQCKVQHAGAWCTQAIPAFEEAVAGMRAGGVRRLELAGERPELGWDRDRSSSRAGSFSCQQLSATSNSAAPAAQQAVVLRRACTSVTGLCCTHGPHTCAVGIRRGPGPKTLMACALLTSYWVSDAWCLPLDAGPCSRCKKSMLLILEAHSSCMLSCRQPHAAAFQSDPAARRQAFERAQAVGTAELSVRFERKPMSDEIRGGGSWVLHEPCVCNLFMGLGHSHRIAKKWCIGLRTCQDTGYIPPPKPKP
jgi:hypothetical protein